MQEMDEAAPEKSPSPDVDPCAGCIFEREDGGNYREICGTCARFYSDWFKER